MFDWTWIIQGGEFLQFNSIAFVLNFFSFLNAIFFGLTTNNLLFHYLRKKKK